MNNPKLKITCLQCLKHVAQLQKMYDLSEKNPFVKAVPSSKSKPKKSKKKQRDVLKEKDAIQDCSKESLAQAVVEELQKVYQNELGPEPIPFTVPGHAIDDEDERGETSNSDIHRRRHCEVFDDTGDNIDDFDDADDIRDDFDGSCTTPATPPTVPFNHASNSSLQSRFEMYADPEITLTDQETAQWYYDGLQNVDDLYPAPGSLDNMPDEYEDGRSTTPPQSRPTNAAGPSGAATPTPTTGVADISTPPRRRFRAEVQDPPVVPQNSAEVQDPPMGQQNSAEVQDPPAGQQNSAEVQDPPVGIQNSPNVQDPPLMAQQTSKVQDPPVNCRPVRLRKRGWQQTTPYTDPCKPKRAKSASHKFKPDEKVDVEVLADYVAFKEEPNGRRDVDIQLIVDVPWFVQFESNNSFLEDTINMVKWWEEMMLAGTTDKPSEELPVLSYKWTAEQIAWARGKNVGGCRPWNEVDTLLIPVNVGGGHWLMAKVGLTLRSIRLYDPVGQPDEYQVRNQQLAYLSEKNPFVKAVPSSKTKPKKSKKKQRDVLKEKDAIQDCSKESLAQVVAEEMQKVYQNELGPEPIPFTVPGHAIDDEDRYFLEVDNASDDDGNVENLSENTHENRCSKWPGPSHRANAAVQIADKRDYDDSWPSPSFSPHKYTLNQSRCEFDLSYYFL
ncbi:hypothetical protein LWI29_021778 [Acer saccharum]|uniref:Ribosome biogenesis protein NOP53 n=1 Tax=Acer saccharum TaxID=4024 RepID=A0AA39VVK1_ACESA|nr:hypothetical protein LWI29_021778 [Acer saccharum]